MGAVDQTYLFALGTQLLSRTHSFVWHAAYSSHVYCWVGYCFKSKNNMSIRQFVLVCQNYCFHIMSVLASLNHVELAKTSPKFPKKICLGTVPRRMRTRLTRCAYAKRTDLRCTHICCVSAFNACHVFTNLINVVADFTFFPSTCIWSYWPFSASFGVNLV